MREILWRLFAFVVSRRVVADWLIARSQRTPYFPITSRDGSETYMHRWWLFNPYTKDADGNTGPARWSWLPSARVQHILRADDDEHLHDHPWDARTCILRNWYEEERPITDGDVIPPNAIRLARAPDGQSRIAFLRCRGYTGPVRFNSYHRISEVAPGGVYTLWITWKYQDTWGFMVDGKKVPWREYLAARPRA